MELLSRIWVSLFLGALIPTFANCIRPFRVPTNLFVQGTSPFTLPEGTRIVRREVHDPDELEGRAEEDLDSFEGWHSRVRRATSSPQPETSVQGIEQFDTLYMYWPPNSEKENVVFLQGKKTVQSTRKTTTISKVYVSRDYGKNFKYLNVSLTSGKPALIDNIYCSKADPKLCILADKKNKVIFQSEDLETFSSGSIPFVPSYISLHPTNPLYVMAYDNETEALYRSGNKGKRFKLLLENVKSFHWGVDKVNPDGTIFVEVYNGNRATRKDNRTSIFKFEASSASQPKDPLADDVDEFEIMKNYMFITTRKNKKDKNPILKVAKISDDYPPVFKKAQFPSNEESRDFFVFDVVDDFVFIVINHARNSSNMYVSDTDGVKYQLSLPRVLYHNPYTDVSSPWLRTVVPYAFVDVDRIKGVRGIYIATQLTPGPVGKRHLRSLITYNRGAKWQRIRSPTVDNRGARIYCYLPTCSIHVNLLYGAVYRVSPSDRLMSSEAAPGLILTLGVASTNLKIYPDLFMSLDGGYAWKRVLRGKYLFTFGDHGGALIAVPYRRFTRSLRYSIDGGATWKLHIFTNESILARDVVTQPGERLPVFLIYGTKGVSSSPWKVFYVNLTAVMGPVCDSSAYVTWTDGCLMGHQHQIETRNWTIHCHMGRNFSRTIDTNKCECRRDDFQCDYLFERKDFDKDCTPIRQGVDLNHQIIPDNCTEGTNYSRTQGYRKIPGNTCENGTEEQFLPVSTPCPAKELRGLDLTCHTEDNQSCDAIAIGQTVHFKADLEKGYLPNVHFGWYYHEGKDEVGPSLSFSERNYSFDKPGKFIVSVVASNTRSILVKWLGLYVQEILDDKRVTVNFDPKNPHPNEPVIFSVNLNYSNEEVGNIHYNWKYDDGEINGTHPVATIRFKKAHNHSVQVIIKNGVSSLTKTAAVPVTLDLSVLNGSARVLSSTSIAVKWKPPANADSTITYQVFQSTLGYSGYQQSTCTELKTSRSCTVNKLTPATTYYFKVRAVTAASEVGPFSDIVIATTNNSLPGMPVNLRAYATSSSSISVEWAAPSDYKGENLIYIIRYWSQDNTSAVININRGNKMSQHFTNLNQDTYYFFEVLAQNMVGRSMPAGPVSALTELSKPTLAPREITVSSTNDTCAMLIWKAPYVSSVDNRTFPAKGYIVTVNSKTTLNVPTEHARVCNLSPGGKYYGTILAYSHAGNGPSAAFTINMHATKPGVPRNLGVQTLSQEGVTLKWDPVPSTGSRVTGYIIYQIPPVQEKKHFVQGEKTSFFVSGLEPYTTYEFTISAKNSLGTSAKSAALQVLTPMSSPGLIKYVNAEAIEPKSATIKLTWSIPERPNGAIRSYQIKYGKSSVEVTPDFHGLEVLDVPGSVTAHTFKNLFSSTSYSFTVFARNDAGLGSQHIDPVHERTYPALKGTERLQLQYDGPRMDGHDIHVFEKEFIQAASKKAGMLDARLAAAEVKRGGTVEFDLLLPFNESGVSMQKAKQFLDSGFNTKSWSLSAGTLKLLFVYDGYGQTASSSTGRAVAGRGGASEDSSIKTQLAIGLPLALIALALLFGMIFYYLKFRSLQKHVISTRYQEGDEMDVVYSDEMEADSPDVIFSDHTRKKKMYKDAEKVPLGENDELAMV